MTRSRSFALLAGALHALLAIQHAPLQARAFFRMGCAQPVVVERADPIVSPGKVSGHVHQILGSNGFNFNESYADARAGSCSTCQAAPDNSNYWTPTLYYQAKNGSFHPVNQVGGGTVYYLQRTGNGNNNLAAFPEGFRMLAGSPTLRSFNASSLEQQAVSFVCLDYNGSGAGGQWNYLPKHNCPDGVRTQIFFPSCWDGVNVDSADHKSHMAYPSHQDSGDCPASHPVRLISIFIEVIWDTNSWNSLWWEGSSGTQQPFVLSMGDPTGYGYHGDFINGWDVPALERAIAGCTQQSGVIEDCQNVLPLRSNDEMNDCAMNSRVPEKISGWLPTLPGCNPVTPGPGPATMVSGCGATTDILPASDASFLKSGIQDWTAVGCAIDNGTTRVLPNRWAPGGMTIELCLAHCASQGNTYAGLEWSQECWCGNTLDQSKVGNYVCNMPCQGDETEFCGASSRLAVYKHTPGSSGSVPSSTFRPPAVSSTTASVKSTPKTTSTKVNASTTTHKATTSSSHKAATTSSHKATTTSHKASSTPVTASGTSFKSPDGNWDSLGCYFDPVFPRALQGENLWTGVPMTAEACIKHCQSKGFTYAGTEWSTQCFCGNQLIGSKKEPDSDCNMKCSGDKSQMCGAGNRLNLYKRKSTSGHRRSFDPHLNAHFARAHSRRMGIARLGSDYFAE